MKFQGLEPLRARLEAKEVWTTHTHKPLALCPSCSLEWGEDERPQSVVDSPLSNYERGAVTDPGMQELL